MQFAILLHHHPSRRNRRLPLPLAGRGPAAAGGDCAAAPRVGAYEHRPVGGVAAGGVFVAFRADVAPPPGPGVRAAGRAGAGLPAAAAVRGPLVGRVSDRPAGNHRSGARASDWPGGGHVGPLRPRRLAAGVPAGSVESRRRDNPNSPRSLRLSVGLFQPTAAAEHLFELVQLQLERLRIASPVTAIRVAATLTAPLEPPRQATLFDCEVAGTRRVPVPHTACADYIRTFGRAGGAAQQPAGSGGRAGRAAAARGPAGTGLALRPAGGKAAARNVAGTRRVPAPHAECAELRTCRTVAAAAAAVVAAAAVARLWCRRLACTVQGGDDACTTIAAAMVPAGRPGAPDRAPLGTGADRDRLVARPGGGPRLLPRRNRRRPPLLALPPAARWKMVLARECSSRKHVRRTPLQNELLLPRRGLASRRAGPPGGRAGLSRPWPSPTATAWPAWSGRTGRPRRRA